MSALERVAVLIGTDPLKAFRQLDAANRRRHELKTRAAEKRADLASLRAQFWGGDSSNFMLERKVFQSEMMEARRAEQERAGEKVTEGALEKYANAHPAYKSWLATQHERRERMYRLEAELAQIEADAEAAEGEMELARQAIRLNEELIRHSRAEAGLTS